ncbi:ketopantoate reductase family protein [Solimicrobium silvestre]|uniref:2-dehydropantoate 2-reductase n=1 Tax=Solimicrobium silvestre TaxID=2099400 RepID=A0A2S9H331_9BURK|nr:ketopantoate reductase family protein [Solimicrobium silvestre]PRC94381.1 2-dehydropantoate 2-reductase [Solimicrobium silvestre]
MRILILGVGGTGGYYGARLAAAGCDVTFLLRPGSAQRIARDGLKLTSVRGDVHMPVQVVTQVEQPADLVILSCKSYDLEAAIAAITPAVGAHTLVLPLLNGLRHLERLNQAFGRGRVLGGMCNISVGRSADGAIEHYNRYDELRFGAQPEAKAPGPIDASAVAEVFKSAHFLSVLSSDIEQDMWEKFVFITTLAGMTCALRSDIGGIVATAPGDQLMRDALAECQAVAAANGHAVRPLAHKLAMRAFTEKGSTFAASMLRDLQAGHCTEAEHIVGDMAQCAAAAGLPHPCLRMALCHLQVYEHALAA